MAENAMGANQAAANPPSEAPPRPLLLLHGFPLTAAMWRPTVDRFRGERTVIAPEVEALFGGDLANPTIERMAEGALHLLEAEAPGSTAVVAGLSMGGYVAMEFARSFPDRLAGLVLCDTRCNADSEQTKVQRNTMIGEVLAQDVDVGTRPIWEKLLSPASAPSIHDAVKAMVAEMIPAVAVACLHAMRDRRDYCFTLQSTRAPSLVVRGADDLLVTQAVMETMTSYLENGRYVEIPGAGHVPPLETPEAFNRELDLFLKTHHM